MKNIIEFITQTPVFTRKEFVEFLEQQGTTNPTTQTALLQYHLKQKHIVRIKQGLFASIPRGTNPSHYLVDPYLIAGKLAPDAVLAYHTALAYHGLGITVFNNFTFCTNIHMKPLIFQGSGFKAVTFPSMLRRKNQELFATEGVKHQGLTIKLTSLERTFVDVLDQPNRSGGWEEIYRSIDTIAILNLQRVIEYTLLLGKATTVSKVGYFLEKMQDTLGVQQDQLKMLEKHIPKQPHYLDRSTRKGGKFFQRWNLIVPNKIVSQKWEDPRQAQYKP